MDAVVRQFVRERAGDACEYCRLPQYASPLATLHVEHIIARKHGGSDDTDNLAMACIDCNLHKGSNLAGLDPATGVLTELFNPRRHAWGEHFFEQDGVIAGKTSIGRTTVFVLRMNQEDQIELRRSL